MEIFYLTIILTSILSFISYITHKKYKIFSFIFLCLVIIILVSVSGLRYGIGDTGYYKLSYTQLAHSINSKTFNISFEGDYILNLLSVFLIQFSTNPQLLIFIVALITNLLNILVFYKFNSYLYLQIFMYITSGYYIVTMNGIRQSLAAAFLFILIPLLIKRKFWSYLLFVLLISGIHGSAIIMIPIYFIIIQKPWSKRIFVLILFSIVGILLYDKLSPLFFKIISNTQYGHYSTYDQGGSSLIRTVVNAVPVIIAYIRKKELQEIWPESNIFVNLSLINLIIVGLGMHNWIFNRLSIYLNLYNFILLPFLIKYCCSYKEKRILFYLFLVCYFTFFYVEQAMGMRMTYYSEYLNYYNLFYNTK